MRELLTARRRAEELDHALEGDGGNLDPSLQAPLRAAVLLRAREPVSPGSDFESELRAALVAEVESAFEPVVTAMPQRPRHRGRRLVAAASALVIVGAGTGVATAAQQALPGDLLYPVKRSLESVQLSIARGNFSRGGEYLDEASTRLDEVAGLADRGGSDEQTTSDISSTIQDFTEQATVGGQLLMEAYRTDGDNGALAQVRLFTTSAAVQMSDLAAAVPDVAQQSFAHAEGTVGSLDSAAVIVCPDCTDSLPAVQVPSYLLSVRTFLPDVDPSTLPIPSTAPLPATPGVPDITLTPLPAADPTIGPPTTAPTVPPSTVVTTAPGSGPPVTIPVAPATDVPTGAPTSVPTDIPTSPFTPTPSTPTPTAPTPTGPTTPGTTTGPGGPITDPTTGPTTGPTGGVTTDPTASPPTVSASTATTPTDSQPSFPSLPPSTISVPAPPSGVTPSPSLSPSSPSTASESSSTPSAESPPP